MPIEKELDNGKTIKYKIKFIDSFRFMSSSLSNLVDNLTEELQNDKYTDCKSCLDYKSIKNNQLFFRRFDCKKHYKKDFNKDSQIYMNFVIKTLINLFCFYEKVFIHG